jgi:serine/threonine protein kinase
LDSFLQTLHEEDKLQLSRNLIDAMQRLHEAGVYHGDIKPSNIIVNPESLEVQFIDIGSMASRISAQRIYDLNKTTISLLPPPLNQHRQMAQLHNSCTFDEKKKLDNYALFLIVKDLIPMNQQLNKLKKQGQQTAQNIITQIQKTAF